MSRICACGKEIPFGDVTFGPVAQVGSLKFYDTAAHFGHPSSRQKVYFCDVCTTALIEFLKERQRSGPGPGEVPE